MTSFRITKRIVAALAAVVGLTAFSAFAQVAPQIVSGPTVAEAETTDTSAVVRWQTNVESTSVVNFGKTASLGQEFKKIVPIEETETTEISHAMTLWGLEPGTTYFYQVRSTASGLTTQSDVRQFTTKAAACTADDWACGDWAICLKDAAGNYAQSRTCTMRSDCAGVETPKPSESRACVPACDKDTWSCGEWGACSVEGKQARACTLTVDCPGFDDPRPPETRSCSTPQTACKEDLWSCVDWGECRGGSQSRTCTLKSDCAGVTTAKPAVTRTCVACTADKWTCAEWGECGRGGMRERKCTLVDDCPTVQTPAPAQLEECVPPPDLLADAQELQHSREPAEKLAGVAEDTDDDTDGTSPPAPPAAAADFEKDTEGVNGGFGLMGSVAVPASALNAECAAAGILPERCASWLEAKYADDACTRAGITTKEACEKYLSDKAGGVFPGCEGLTPEACDAVKARATFGYLPAEDKKKVDEIITTKKVGDAFAELGDAAPLLVAVRVEKKDEVKWWPSSKEEGQETAPGVIVFDADKDGLPDDVEKRLGTDPNKADTDGDGTPDGEQVRDALKAFFEKGDKPTQPQFAAMLDSLASVDRAFILGNAIGQPRGAGEIDASFGLTLASGPVATDREIIRCRSEKDCPAEYPFCRDGYCYGDGQDANSPAPVGYRQVNDDNKDVANKADSSPKPSNVLKGKATPDTTVLLYVYSYVPMVLTTTTDGNGNFAYDLADSVVDGRHEVYVAVTDDTGKITKKSEPLAFFVKGAVAATSEEDFLRPDVDVRPDAAISSWARYYLYGTAFLVLVALGFGWRFMSRMKGQGEKAQ